MTDEELAQIEARAEAAEPGPWSWDCDRQGIIELVQSSGPHWVISSKTVPVTCPELGSGERVELSYLLVRTNDADFIAAAREDVPRLIAEVRRLRAEMKVIEALGGKNYADTVLKNTVQSFPRDDTGEESEP